MAKVDALNDGTDIMTDANRQSSGIKRLHHSNKVHHAGNTYIFTLPLFLLSLSLSLSSSGVRGVTWAVTSGLTFEHSDIVAARTSEASIVYMHGSMWKPVPLDSVIQNTCTYDKLVGDSEDRRLLSVSTSMKKLRKEIGKISKPGREEDKEEQKEEEEQQQQQKEEEEFEFLYHQDEDQSSIQDQFLANEEDREEKGDAKGFPAVRNICQNVRQWFAGQKKMHDERYTADESKHTVLTVERIRDYNKSRLLDYGPNKDNKTKLRQLLRLEYFHNLFETHVLDACSLSYYLYHTKEVRDAMLRRLGVDTTELPTLYTRLAKLPSGYLVLADRGFAHDAPKYPNLNGQVTPHFKGERKQFQRGEIEVDRGACTLRYTSEVIFKHMFNEQTLKDSVPFGLFSILSDCWDWAHAASNSNAPLRKPRDWEKYLQRQR